MVSKCRKGTFLKRLGLFLLSRKYTIVFEVLFLDFRDRNGAGVMRDARKDTDIKYIFDITCYNFMCNNSVLMA